MSRATNELTDIIAEMEQRGCLEFMESEASGQGEHHDAVKRLTGKVRRLLNIKDAAEVPS